ncbi:MAG: efflux RND transporter periplasmic adaptor subunit [Rhodospirillaceae bacterium]
MTDRPTSDTAPTAREQSRQAFVYEAILDSMSDGMMTVDFEGRIRGLNPAAEKVLGVSAGAAAGTTLVEFFFDLPDNDAFLDAILAAIAPGADVSGDGHGQRHYLDFHRPDGSTVALSLTISDLRREQDGAVQRLGIVCVFSDVTELRDLRAAEQDMARKLEENHRKLATAYRDLEAKSSTLEGNVKRVQVWRLGITAAVFVVFTGVGLYAWFATGQREASGDAGFETAGTAEATRTWRVEPRPLRKSIDLVGQIEPGNTVSVLAPFNGPVLEKHFEFGARVEAGDLLAVLDTAELDAQHRDAKAGLIKAEQAMRELQDWAKGVEVARARRALQAAERSLTSAQQKTRETKQLLDLGVVARQEYQDALDRELEADRSVMSSREELDGVLDKGAARNRLVAELELANARQKLADLERKLESARIRAPVGGVIIRPPTQTGSEGGGGSSTATAEVTQGTKLTEAQAILAIASLDNLRVDTSLLEIDVNKVTSGMRVLVTGEAFPGTTLEGRLTSIANQATKGAGASLPQFGISVLIEDVGDAIVRAVRLGMTASLQIVTHDDPAALVVPVPAVQTGPDGTTVRRRNPATGQVEPVAVTLGQRLPEGVQILSGLSAGDEVAY